MKTIYALIDPKSGKPQYIGCTANSLEKRLKEHLKSSKKPKFPVHKWIKQLRKDNLIKDLKIISIEKVSEKSWESRESFWINKMRKKFGLFNITFGGKGTTGLIHSKKTRAKIRLKRATQTFSEETRKKLSIARMGNQNAKGIRYKRNPEDLKKTWATRRKNGTDRPSEESRKKMSKARYNYLKINKKNG